MSNFEIGGLQVKEMKHTKKKRINKWLHMFVVQGNYGYGWDDLCSSQDYYESRRDLKDYRDSERDFSHRLIERRVLNPRYKPLSSSTQRKR